MYKFALIGTPLTHSISAVIQKAGLKSLGLEGEYDILDTDPEDLVSRIKFLKTQGYNGFNVTIPLKVPVSLFIDDIDDSANIIGCVNTVKIKQDRSFIGFNTDIYGFKAALEGIDLQGANVSIIGTGGAARAAAAGSAALGAKEIDFYTRNIINSTEAVNYIRHMFPEVQINVYQTQNIRDLSHTDMLVNATPIGMRGHSADQTPLGYQSIKQLKDTAIVYDIIYNPSKTVFLEMAQSRGLKTINGLDMLINQGAKSLEIWTGKKPDIKEMKISALQAI